MRHFTSPTGKLALSAVVSALSLVLMLLLGAVGIGTYAGPLLGGVCTLVVLIHTDRKTALLHWLATGLLTLLLSPDAELSLFYLLLFGWYPVAKPGLDALKPAPLVWASKFALFNAVTLALYATLLQLLYAGDLQSLGFGGVGMTLVMLLMGNVIFFCYDKILARLKSQKSGIFSCR